MAKTKITQVTVLQMYQALAKEIKKGNGNKYLVVSDDNEGNGYHGCFYHISPMEPETIDLVTDLQVLDPDKLMIIG